MSGRSQHSPKPPRKHRGAPRGPGVHTWGAFEGVAKLPVCLWPQARATKVSVFQVALLARGEPHRLDDSHQGVLRGFGGSTSSKIPCCPIMVATPGEVIGGDPIYD